MITADQLVAHAIGDYVLQSDWMANEKTKKSVAAGVHAVTYAIPFLFITTNLAALTVIVVTHFAIDRWRLARYICWAKNFLQPGFQIVRTCSCGPNDKCDVSCGIPLPETVHNHSWSECSGTGYHKDRAPWMAVWLLIITDNILHVLINGMAIEYLG